MQNCRSNHRWGNLAFLSFWEQKRHRGNDSMIIITADCTFCQFCLQQNAFLLLFHCCTDGLNGSTAGVCRADAVPTHSAEKRKLLMLTYIWSLDLLVSFLQTTTAQLEFEYMERKLWNELTLGKSLALINLFDVQVVWRSKTLAICGF